MNIDQARTNMLTQQLRTYEVLDPQVLAIIGTTPREQFVPARYRNLAYADMAIPLDHQQVMLPPKEEARLLQALALQASDTVLEIGTGTGYMTALLARVAKQVDSVDIFADFTEYARHKLKTFTVTNVELHTGDAANGWPQQGPYDAIVITGAMLTLPQSFRDSLRLGGRLVAILGKAPAMAAVLITREQHDVWSETRLFETVVPPLLHAAEPPLFVF